MELNADESCSFDGLPLGKNSRRTEQQVREAADAAGLQTVEDYPVQVFRFSDDLRGGSHLLELHHDLEKALKEGDRVCIRGLASDEAILCTGDKSFEVKLVDTSNTLLLCRDVLTPGQEGFTAAQSAGGGIIRQEVCGSASSYLEVRPCRGRISRLVEVLSENQYSGPEAEPEDFVAGYTFNDLLDVVQGSEEEVHAGLKRCKACLMNGFWRILETDYFEQAFDRIVQSLAEKDWPITDVPVDDCCKLLEELLPRVVIEHCLACHGRRSNDDMTYCLDEARVSQFYAEYLLRRVARFNYVEFMDVWQQTVPLGITVSLDMLKGVALHDMTARPPVVWHFPADHLPFEVAPRFNALFSERTKWTLPDLAPYIEDLATPQQPLESLLLKHTRSAADASGQKLYNSRQPL